MNASKSPDDLKKMARARDLGIPLEGTLGRFNAITDVAGVTVGYTTLIEGAGPLVVGQGPVRTGVTAILPRGKAYDPVFAGWYSLNGNGEMTGTTWIEESGFLEGPVVITNTHSVGVARDAVVEWQLANNLYDAKDGIYWSLPVVAETYDGYLNDINGFHVTREHVFHALDGAASGPIVEGNVGGGTGMVCHFFKGGTGTASRVLDQADGGYTVGVLVQANYGSRESLTIGGIPVGKQLTDLLPEWDFPVNAAVASGSIIVAVATDAPLLPHQLKRIAARVPMGIAKTGGYGSNDSGDIFIAWSTANPGAANRTASPNLTILPNERMSLLFQATVQATEEAIINALTAAKTMVGIGGNTVHALPVGRVREILQKHNRLTGY
jgi:L-aminopeptidase/D-esterase-like protein